MNTTASVPIEAGSSSAIPLSERGPAPANIVAAFGFWLFLLSDIILFAALFAGYAVLAGQVAGGPSGVELFDTRHVLLETACLLLSSVTCGLALVGAQSGSVRATYTWGTLTFMLGGAFLTLEWVEFARMLAQDAGPTRSAFLSAFFALVGAHGLHVAIGLCWLLIMAAQIATLGFRPLVMRRLLCFSLYWHALDIVWVGVFTIVYLGAR